MYVTNNGLLCLFIKCPFYFYIVKAQILHTNASLIQLDHRILAKEKSSTTQVSFHVRLDPQK